MSVNSPSTSNPLSASNENASHPDHPILLPPPYPQSVDLPPASPLRIGVSGAHRPGTEIPSKLPTHEVENLDQWFEDLEKYEATLEAMAQASVDVKFKEELSTIEQWFNVLSEAEKTATLYTLLQHSTQLQIRFFIAVLQQMARSDGTNPLSASLDSQMKTKQNRNLRPPSLNLPSLGSPSASHFNNPNTPRLTSALDSAALRSSGEKPTSQLGQILEHATPAQEVSINGASVFTDESSWANMVNTPLVPMFKKEQSDGSQDPAATTGNGSTKGVHGMTHATMSMPGFPAINSTNPFDMNMLGAMKLSTEAQLLAVQMVMGGLAQQGRDGRPQPQWQPQPQQPKTRSYPKSNNWRAPPSAKYPGSALRSSGLSSGGLSSSGLKSGGLKSGGLKSASSTESTQTQREEDFDPEILKDVPAWLRSLRLHKYTSNFDGLSWQEMVVLDDPALEAKGIVALGARRRLLKTFDMVKKKMFADSPTSAVLPSTNSLPTIISSPSGLAPGELPSTEEIATRADDS